MNLNATGDDHVSFTAAHLALSPCGSYLLISTDGARIIMMAIAGMLPRLFCPRGPLTSHLRVCNGFLQADVCIRSSSLRSRETSHAP